MMEISRTDIPYGDLACGEFAGITRNYYIAGKLVTKRIIQKHNLWLKCRGAATTAKIMKDLRKRMVGMEDLARRCNPGQN